MYKKTVLIPGPTPMQKSQRDRDSAI